MRRRLTPYDIAFLWFGIGIAVCWVWAKFELRGWIDLYYIWDKSKDLLFLIALYYLIPKHAIRSAVACGVLALIRILWEIISIITHRSINDQGAMNILFLAMSTGLAMYLLIDLRKRWKQNS